MRFLNSKVLCSFFVAVSAGYSAVTITGTSLKDVTGLSSGDFGAYLVSTDGSPLTAGSFSFSPGASVTDSATYGPSFSLVGTNTASEFLGTTSLASGHSFDLVGGIDSGDVFGIITFTNSTSTLLAGDSFYVWTSGNWDVPINGQTETFGTELSQLDGVAASSTGTVVPEPSSYAMLLGAAAMAMVTLLRRK